MINNLKDNEEVLKELDKISLEELDEAIKNADKEFEVIGNIYENKDLLEKGKEE